MVKCKIQINPTIIINDENVIVTKFGRLYNNTWMVPVTPLYIVLVPLAHQRENAIGGRCYEYVPAAMPVTGATGNTVGPRLLVVFGRKNVGVKFRE